MASDDYSEYNLTATTDIYGILRKLAINKQVIHIQITDTFKKYQSQIIDVDIETLSFNLQRLTPEEGNAVINAGNRFHIEAQYQGAKISFRVNNRMSYQPEHKQYRVEFPSEITYLQRRSCFRVETSANDIHVHLGTDLDDRVATGRLLDLSSDGFKARFEMTQDKKLKLNKKYPLSRLRFADGQTLKLSLIRHHVEYANRQILYGFRILEISPMEQRYLDQNIQQLQWQQNQKEDDESQLELPDDI